MVQTVRADALASLKDIAPAVAAVEEGPRLLPDDPRPKLVAAGIFTFSGSSQRPADFWMAASREAPKIARMSDRYMMVLLVGRLREIVGRARAVRVSARLGEIGFSGGLAKERSDAALAQTREEVRTDRGDDPRPKLVATELQRSGPAKPVAVYPPLNESLLPKSAAPAGGISAKSRAIPPGT